MFSTFDSVYSRQSFKAGSHKLNGWLLHEVSSRWHTSWGNLSGHSQLVHPGGDLSGCLLGFRNLGPCIFEWHGSVEEECVR